MGALGRAFLGRWTICEWSRAWGQEDNVNRQPAVSQALCWALLGDCVVTSAVVINS